MVVIGAGPKAKPFRDFARRAISHKELKNVCKEFEKPTPKPGILKNFWNQSTDADPLSIIGDSDFATICVAVQDLQDQRHRADYDFSKQFSRTDALDAYRKVSEAMDAWDRLKKTKAEALKLFAMSILLWPGVSGRG
jgi:hypothetical protein